MQRRIFTSAHEDFRSAVRRFIERDITPRVNDWDDAGIVSRDVWRAIGQMGMLCPDVPEQYGGPDGDFLFNAIVHEELARGGAHSLNACLIAHSDIVAAYLLELGSEEQKMKWLPKMVSGEAIAAIGMSEPEAGSDLKSIRTSARPNGAGGYLLSGQKTFITNGHNADLVVVACKSSEKGISLFLLDTVLPGYRRGRMLEKIGQKAGDTAELFFDDVPLAAADALGELGAGFKNMMKLMPRERLAIVTTAISEAEVAYDLALQYVRERRAFGQRIVDFQAIRFKLAEIAADLEVARVYVDRCIDEEARGEFDIKSAAISKFWVTDIACKAIDDCLQLFGGYGYMREYPISRLWTDSRIHRIYGGTNEIMKEIIGRQLAS
ncbi:acyl-CoA dehydrogenase family protein [Microvirga antarctica]|uniref:acyl-CoA dehydrogenase family protein n=1 Tax=Microvirga antarctica TaxID=2819233 RepID=UPI001B3161BF|nr:acyl-CoA dehydrogenase family protein [Microvirga antarctica]